MTDRLDLTDTVERRSAARLLDVLVRAGLILALALLCYRVFSPFLILAAWASILAVTLYPLQVRLARAMGGRRGLAATAITLLGIALIVAPTAVLLVSLGDSVHRFVHDMQHDTLHIPPPHASVRDWPLVGERSYALWDRAHADLPSLVQRWRPQIGELAKEALSMVAEIGGGILKFIAAFIVAGIVMAFGEGAERPCRAFFARVAGAERSEQFRALSVATIRAVALGVVGIAFVQAIAVGLCLLLAGIPMAGVLAGIVLVLGIAQVPALLVTLPAIAFLWMGGNHGTLEASAYSVLLFAAGMVDNVLKPLMLGRGVDAPMPVILIGALGGMATAGIVGLFVGATLLALGYRIFTGWIATEPDPRPPS